MKIYEFIVEKLIWSAETSTILDFIKFNDK